MVELDDSDSPPERRVLGELIAYFALTFAITFGFGAAFIFFRPQFEFVFGPIGPPLTSWPYYVAVCAPTISAVAVTFGSSGWRGVKSLFSGLVRRFQLRWAFAALLTIPIGLIIVAFVERAVWDGASNSIDIHAILISAPLLWFTTPAIFVDPGPWGEETGWRGFALPRLLRRFSPLPAAVILGAIWGLWHTPAFFVSGLTQFGLPFAWFLVAGTCGTIFMTWIYLNANRNYLVAGFIPHAVSNLMFTAHAYSSVKIEALLYAAIAVFVVTVSGPSLRGWRLSRAVPAEPSRTAGSSRSA